MPTSSPPLGSIQFLRFVAAALVVAYHAVVHLGPAAPVAVPDGVYAAAWIGAAGVHVFFLISGFIMVLTSWTAFGTRGATGRFLVRRAIRIYPIYWIAASLYLAAGAAGAIAPGPDPATALLALLLVPGYGPAIIPPGWTLTFEVYFYLAFGLALLLPRGPALALLGGAFCGAVALGAVTGIGRANALLDHATSVLLLEFLAGVAIGAWHASGRWPARLSRPAPLLLLLALSAALFAAAPALNGRGIPTVLSLGLPSALLVVAAVAAQGSAARPALDRVAWLGDSSYALYLVHLLVILLMVPLAGTWATSGLRLGLLGALAVAASLGAGLLLHHRIEAPLLALLRRRLASDRAGMRLGVP